MNHYQLLGVSESATISEIKEAYKNLAKKYHPDNKDTGNVERMVDINNSYNILKNKKTKDEYDNSIKFFKFTNNQSNKTADDNVEKIFNIFGRDKNFNKKKDTKQQVKDCLVDFEITMEQSYIGYNSTVQIQLPNGSIRTINLVIPAGIENNDKIVFESGDTKISDLYINIKILEHEFFKRDKNNVLVVLDIDSFDAMLGREISLEYLDGKNIEFKIKSGIQQNEKILIKNKGFPKLNSSIRGDLIISINILTPILSKKQKELLQKYKINLD